MLITKQIVINHLQEMDLDDSLLQNLWSQILINQETASNSKKTKQDTFTALKNFLSEDRKLPTKHNHKTISKLIKQARGEKYL